MKMKPGRAAKSGINSIVATLLFAGILVIINLISTRNNFRIDFTGIDKFTLSPQTISVLKNLKEPVFCRFSHLKKSSAPLRSLRLLQVKIEVCSIHPRILCAAFKTSSGTGSSVIKPNSLFDFFDDGAHDRNLDISSFVAPKIVIANGISAGILFAGNLAISNRPGFNDLTVVGHIRNTKVLAQQIICLFKHLVPGLFSTCRKKEGQEKNRDQILHRCILMIYRYVN